MPIVSMPEAQYHARPEISKSGLWTIHTRTPGHFKYQVKEPSKAMDFGSAIHTAVLEPHLFDAKFMRGPDDRRGNAWKAAVEMAESQGRTCLVGHEWEEARQIANRLHLDPLLKALADQTVVEQSAFWVDPEFGLDCRMRADGYATKAKLIVDLKTTTDAGYDFWSRNAANFGYHVQEDMYSDGWAAAGGGGVDGFIFVVVEKDPPYFHAIYELEPQARAEGSEIRRRAMQTYEQCLRTNTWPDYDKGVTPLNLPRWAFKFTQPAEEAA